eukprot:TRINITY_DN23159_c0_g1_i1.p1 TRINITY_DN23159_c0_g1~~TRINITY_DN23159_c0_g1_i1.p1  ORF type:complete len:552 (-),score=82.03 TRINITY_DN23159_c0_g1_i1:58-1713(-)
MAVCILCSLLLFHVQSPWAGKIEQSPEVYNARRPSVSTSDEEGADCVRSDGSGGSSCEASDEDGFDVSALLQLGSRSVIKRKTHGRLSSSSAPAKKKAAPADAAGVARNSPAREGTSALSNLTSKNVANSNATANSDLANRNIVGRYDRERNQPSSHLEHVPQRQEPLQVADAAYDYQEVRTAPDAKARFANGISAPSAHSPPLSFFQVDMEDDGSGGASDDVTTIWLGNLALSRHSLALCVLVVLLVVAVGTGAAAQSPWLPCKKLRRVTSVRHRTERLQVIDGSKILDMFGANTDSEALSQPMSPGMLMRIQGRIVAKPQNALVAPFSGRACVSYSASVAHRRLDGVHQPPMAFHSACTDFALELLDCPEVQLTVHGHDVSLFDMVGGSRLSEHSFATAPDSWRAFALSHLVTGASVGSADRAAGPGLLVAASGGAGAAGAAGAGGPLEFRECALLVGATVTCVGEVARDRFGHLGLFPWRPPAPSPSPPAGAGRRLLASPASAVEMLSWEHLKTDEIDDSPSRDILAGQVMVSDDPTLLPCNSWRPVL